MKKLPHPKEIFRTTLADEIPDVPGVYVFAYLGKVLYVGISTVSVKRRIREHQSNAIASNELLGQWMIKCTDWENIRVDVLIPPDSEDQKYWLRTAESTCIRRLIPLLNQQHSIKYAKDNGFDWRITRAA